MAGSTSQVDPREICAAYILSSYCGFTICSRGSEFSFAWRLLPAFHARAETLHRKSKPFCCLASRRCGLPLLWLSRFTIASLLTFGHSAAPVFIRQPTNDERGCC